MVRFGFQNSSPVSPQTPAIRPQLSSEPELTRHASGNIHNNIYYTIRQINFDFSRKQTKLINKPLSVVLSETLNCWICKLHTYIKQTTTKNSHEIKMPDLIVNIDWRVLLLFNTTTTFSLSVDKDRDAYGLEISYQNMLDNFAILLRMANRMWQPCAICSHVCQPHKPCRTQETMWSIRCYVRTLGTM